MIRKYHDHKPQTNPRHCEEELQDIYSNKTISSLFLVKMIAKLERTQSNAHQNKDKHRTPKQWEVYNTINQQKQKPPP